MSVSYVDSAVPESFIEGSGVVLPAYFRQTPQGVYVDLTLMSSREEFERMIDRIFSAGRVLRGLDYERLQSLLYGPGDFSGLVEIFLAREITEFPEERRGLYRALKITDEGVEYGFEPVGMEVEAEVPVYGENEQGEQIQVGTQLKTEFVPTQLDFDEFIAHCWSKGVRFGIDAAKVQELIHSGRTERAQIAFELKPTEGHDAAIEEQTQALHRNNAPRLLPDGRVDLGHYANRFPQIREGTLLLMKVPRQLGEAGRNVNGSRIEPRLPDDFELASMAGAGVRVERYNDREYLVASISGFLSIDTQTNQISVTEKIINREGVNARTTGNLVLEGDEYEEYGEVQEGRVVEGKSLTFHADVFGRVTSTGGLIVLDSNLVGGMALNRNGDIEVRGRASSATLRTARGAIRVKHAENSVLVADRVEIESACQCTILAEEVEIGEVEGCEIAGKRVHLEIARDRNSEETLVSMLMPDLSGFERLLAEEYKYQRECEQTHAQLRQGLSVMTSQPEMQNYLIVAGKLHRKEITLTPKQKANWQELGAHVAPVLKRIKQVRADIATLETELAGAQERIGEIKEQERMAGEGIDCRVGNVAGDVRIRPLVVLLDAPPLTRMSPKDLRAHLRNPVPGEKTLFSGDSGSFAWAHQAEGKAEKSGTERVPETVPQLTTEP